MAKGYKKDGFEIALWENGLLFLAQTWKIIDTPDEND